MRMTGKQAMKKGGVSRSFPGKKWLLSTIVSFALITSLCVPSALAFEGEETAQFSDVVETVDILELDEKTEGLNEGSNKTLPKDDLDAEDFKEEVLDSEAAEDFDEENLSAEEEEGEIGSFEDEAEFLGDEGEELGVELFTADQVVTNQQELLDAIAAIEADDGQGVIGIKNDFILTQTIIIPAGCAIALQSEGQQAYVLGIDPSLTGRHFKVEGNLTINSLVLRGKGKPASATDTAMQGGGIRVANSLTLGAGAVVEQCAVVGIEQAPDPSRTANGGGIYAENDSSVVLNPGSAVRSNCAYYGLGGGVYFNEGGSLIINGASIANNEALATSSGNTGNGGGVYAWKYSSVVINNASFTNNVANQRGGGIVTPTAGTCTITGSTFTENIATYGSGGAIAQGSEGSLSLKKCLIKENKARMDAGGVYASGFGGSFGSEGNQYIRNAAGEMGGALYVTGSSVKPEVVFEGDVIKGNSSYGNGGAISTGTNFFSIRIKNTVVEENKTENGGGGAIYLDPNGVKLYLDEDAVIKNNAAPFGAGGGVYMPGERNTLEINGARFEGNAAKGYGGAVYSNYATIKSEGGVFSQNSTMLDGGAVFVDGVRVRSGVYTTSVAFSDTLFEENSAENGGALYVRGPTAISGGHVDLINSYFESNTAAKSGGAICAETRSSVTVESTTFEENEATHGGAIFKTTTLTTAPPAPFSDTVASVESSFISNESASGAAAYIEGEAAEFTVDKSIFEKNEANFGGALLIQTGASAELSNETVLKSNKALGSGGAVYASHSSTTIDMDNTTLTENTADWGGALYLEGSWANLSECSVTKNTARVGAGGIHLADDEYEKLTADKTTFRENATTRAYAFDLSDTALLAVHDANITNTVSLSEPFGLSRPATLSKAYNNYDISYTGGELLKVLAVIYDGNGNTSGEAPVDKGRYLLSDTVIIAGDNGMKRDSHTFKGWSINPSATTAEYAPDATLTMANENVVLYAVWTQKAPQTYAVTYDANGGLGSVVDANKYAQGSTVTVKGKGNLTRSGYTFMGWTLNANGSGSVYNQGNIVNMGASNLVFYAQWRENGGGTVVPPNPDPRPDPNPDPDPTPEAPEPDEGDSTELVVNPKTETTTNTGNKRTETQTNEPEEDQATVALFGNEVPLGGFRDHSGWSLVNLILSLIALIGAGIMIISLFLNRKKEEEDQNEEGTADLLKTRSQNKTVRIVASVLGIAPLVLFLILENFTQMVLFSAWTPLIAVVYLLHLIAFVMGFVVKKNTTEQIDARNHTQFAR